MNTQPNRVSFASISAMYLRERYFWQSRAMLRDPPQLTDLHTLARRIRRGKASTT